MLSALITLHLSDFGIQVLPWQLLRSAYMFFDKSQTNVPIACCWCATCFEKRFCCGNDFALNLQW